MRPPTTGVVSKAATLLMCDVKKQNPIGPLNFDTLSIEHQLEHQIFQYDMALEAITNHLSTQSAALKRRLNAYVPIYKLPLELFVKILLIDLQPYHSRPNIGQNSRRHELAQVAKVWSDTILNTPQCWANIRFGKEQLPASVLLRRSKNAPLAITCVVPRVILHFQQALDPEEFLDEMESHSHRWQSIRIVIEGESADAVAMCVESKAPRLRDLCITLRPPIPIGVLVRPQTEALRHVMLDGVSIPWDSCPLVNLQSLQICNIEDNIPSLERLRTILTNSPGIERLALHKLFTRGLFDRPSTSADLPVIPLPALRSLFIGDIAADLSDFLKTSLQPSPKSSLHINHAVDSDFILKPSIVSPLLEMAGAALRSATRMAVAHFAASGDVMVQTFPYPRIQDWTTWDAERDSEEEDRGMHIRLRTDNAFESVRLVTRFIKAAGVTATLSLFVSAGGVDDLDIIDPHPLFPADALDDLPSTEHMVIDRRADALNILMHLRDPRPEDNRWLCPKLKHLDLERAHGLAQEEFDDFMIGRYGDGDWDDVELDRPTQLQQISLPIGLQGAIGAP